MMRDTREDAIDAIEDLLCEHGTRALCGWCAPLSCHCGESFRYGYDDDPTHHRGMCEHCDSVRCDAFPGECGR